jgi:hypothetical protein
MQLTKKEDQRNLLMIGGIQIFLLHIPVEVRICVVDERVTIVEGQLALTIVKEELEQVLEAAQAEEEDEHSNEWLNTFSQEAEKTAALELAEEKEEEEEDNMSFADLCE